MNKNNIIAFVLIALVLIGFSIYTQPSKEEQRQAFVQDSIARAKRKQAEKMAALQLKQKKEKQQAAILEDTTALFHKALKGKSSKVVLKNSKIELTLNTKGGIVEKALIKGYVGHDIKFKDGSKDSKDVTLFEEKDQSLAFMMPAKEFNINTSDLYFQPSNITDSTVTMTAEASAGKYVVLSYVLGKDYMLHMKLKVTGMSGLFAPDANTVDVVWKDHCRQQERGFTFENRYATLTYHEFDAGSTDYLSETSEKIDEKIDEPIDWVAFKNQFFSAVMISRDN